jgi:hypothetical protein
MKAGDRKYAGRFSCSRGPAASVSAGAVRLTDVGIGAGLPRSCEWSTIGVTPSSAHKLAGVSVSGWPIAVADTEHTGPQGVNPSAFVSGAT